MAIAFHRIKTNNIMPASPLQQSQMPVAVEIPQAGVIAVQNLSDLLPNIKVTKNLNFDLPGYIRLSPRVVAVQSGRIDSNLGLPLSFGRTVSDKMFIATSNKSFIFNTPADGYIFGSDFGTNAPTGNYQSWGAWWQNNWQVTDNTNIWIKNRTTGNWTQASNGGTPIAFGESGVSHCQELFRSQNTMCFADGSFVRQYNTDYSHTVDNQSTTLDLILQTDFEVTSLAFNAGYMGVGTMLSTLFGSTEWQNQDAYFFTWDGATVKPSKGYPIFSDMIIAICAYQTTWALLTRRGRLLVFNGGGFKVLATLPFNFNNLSWSDPVTITAFGKCMTVEDDKIHVNLPTTYNKFGKKGQQYLDSSPGGVWTYDPIIGFYNRYTPSNSLSYDIGVSGGNINLTTGVFQCNTNPPATGNPIKYVFDPANPIGGLTFNTVYYIIRIDSTHFKLAATKADAIAGNFILPTSGGASNNFFLAIDTQDFGASFLPGKTGGIGLFGTETQMHKHMIFGSEIHDGLSGNTYGNLCIVVPGFDNRGYLVTYKITSAELIDIIQKIFFKFRPLRATDSFIIKIRTDDVLGLPVSTPQYSGVTQWVDSTHITTTCDISDAYNYFNNPVSETVTPELECEIISGSGAGQMPQVSGIALNAGTYTITLAEAVDGASVGNFCNILINNWKKKLVIDSTALATTQEVPIIENAKWYEFKVEFRGDGTTMEKMQVISQPSQELE